MLKNTISLRQLVIMNIYIYCYSSIQQNGAGLALTDCGEVKTTSQTETIDVTTAKNNLSKEAQQLINDINDKRKQDTELLLDFKKALLTNVTIINLIKLC